MPSTIIHEEVGCFIGKKLNISSYDYYLGLLAPDAPNLLRFAPKKERWLAHQRSKDYEVWKNNIISFYNNMKDKYPKDFIFGYCVHILTDIVFDEYFYLDLREKIEKDKVPHKESHDVLSKDMQKYKFSDSDIILDILKEEKSYKILNISKDKLLKWKKKQYLLWHKNNDSIYINELLINDLNNKVFDELISLNLKY